MAKVKYDVSNAEATSFKVPKPGVYEAAVSEMSHGNSSSGNPMFTIVFEITKGEYKGSRIWHYILTDGSQEWRLREFTEAVGLKPRGTIDTDAMKGVVVQLKTAVDPATDLYDEKAKVKNVMPAAAGAGASSGAGGGDDEEEDVPYSEWTIDELKEEVEARELEVAGKKTKAKLVKALEEDDESEGDEDEEGEEDEEGSEEGEDEESEDEEEEDDEESYTMADLKGMSRTELKKLISDEELSVKVMKKTTDDQLREAIAKELEIEEKEDEEGEEEDTDYEEWDVSDLKAELKERGLKTDGRKTVLVARLKKDDANDEEPF